MAVTNPEAWAKAVDILLSRWKAAKLLAGALLFLGIMVAGGTIALSNQLQGQVPATVLIILFAVISFTLGVLMIDGLAWVARAAVKKWETRKEKELQQQRTEARRDEVRKSVPYILPDLTPEDQKLLSGFGDGSRKLEWRGAIHELVHI